MAFKKTQNRIRVQPTGLPDFSGYANAARQYENISDLAFGVGAKMREQKVNDLILEAESAGRTAGATYDADNNLVPLTNLDLDKAIEDQVFSESEKSSSVRRTEMLRCPHMLQLYLLMPRLLLRMRTITVLMIQTVFVVRWKATWIALIWMTRLRTSSCPISWRSSRLKKAKPMRI